MAKKKRIIFFKTVFIAIVSFFVLALLSASSFGYQLYKATPSVKGINNFSLKQTSIIYDKTGQTVLYEIHGSEDRKVLTHNEIPDVVRWTTLAAEDDSFYDHHGFDLISILRAAKINLKTKKSAQGASTITQQLARDLYLTREKTYERKIKEIILAVKLEKQLTKDEILDMYLNKISYGSDVYGIQSAAENFFGKSANQLTLDEAALLAALPKAPSHLSPYGKNVDELRTRQKRILFRLYELELVEVEEVKKAISEDTFRKIKPLKDKILAPHFVFYVIEQLVAEYGEEFVKEGGLKIITTLDMEMQQQAEKIVARRALENEKKWNAENAALVALEPKTGNIVAMVGSRNYFDSEIDGKVNVVTRLRQPGSSFKPIIYARAFEKGFQPETKIYDVRTNFGPDGSGSDYIPQNYSGKFHGELTMREALAGSKNVPAVKTLYLAGLNNTIKLANQMGISSLKNPNDYGLSLALGSGDITLMEEVCAYSVFANEGIQVFPAAIKEITNSNSSVVFKNPEKKTRVISAETARKINSVLSDNKARYITFSPKSPLEIPNRQVAVKTGTTQDYRDGWATGYTPSLAVGVWAGNNDNSPMRSGAAGVFVAGPIWNEFISWALQKYPVEKFQDYTRVSSPNLMLAGKTEQKTVFYNDKTGKKLETEEEIGKTDPDKIRQENVTVRHSILYYVDKDNPLGENGPNLDDPMLIRWEKALGNYNNEEIFWEE